mgnify:CR=1 FL=1
MDKHYYYQNSVQCVEAEIDFVEATYKKIKGRNAITLREDFCGTAQTACEWVKRSNDKVAWGVDLDPLVMQWGEDNNIAALTGSQQARIRLSEADVMEAPVKDLDVVLAMNFSYFIFMQRELMLQ